MPQGLVRVTLALAIVIAALVGAAEVVGSVRAVIEGHGDSWKARDRQVAANQGVDPTVLSRLAGLIPANETYTVSIAPRLASTTRGQAFAGLLRWWLLPRLERPNRQDAGWVISWGATPATGTIHVVGRLGRHGPSVIAVSRGE